MEAAALHEYPVLQHPTAKASVPQRSGLPAPCVPCPRAGGVLHLPFTHTQPWLQKPSLPERYTSLLPAEKIAAGILQSAHAAARNSHSSTWLQEQRRPARLPRCHGSQPSQSGWGPRHPARACGSRHPLCTCVAPGCCCPGALPGGCWPGGCELLRLSLMVRLSKLTPAHVGPAPGRPNVRRAPSAAARAVPWRRCAAPRGKLGSWRGRHPPWLAGGERRCAGSHGQCLVWGHLSARQQVTPLFTPASVSRSQRSFPGWGLMFCREPKPLICTQRCGLGAQLSGVDRRFSGTSVQVFSIQLSHLQPLAALPSPHQQHQHEAEQEQI